MAGLIFVLRGLVRPRAVNCVKLYREENRIVNFRGKFAKILKIIFLRFKALPGLNHYISQHF